MNLYPLLKPFLFQLEAEQAHHITLRSWQAITQLGFSRLLSQRRNSHSQPYSLMGLTFPNRVGLAAGLDKNGDYINALGELGFGFIEVGTVTPRPQPGNPQPRLFRLPQAEGIINRMGFNNYGVDYLIERLKQTRYRGLIGVNIGKNFDTPLERAHEDYLICLEKSYPFADYLVVNVSSPNTPGLRTLQDATTLESLISILQDKRNQLSEQTSRRVPLLVKLAPDLSEADLSTSADVLRNQQVDGVIATNTTLDRTAVTGLSHSDERGGLSGAPLTHKATTIIRQLREYLGPEMPIIGVGGIMHPAHAQAKIDAGANLVQIYSGLIYRGPQLVADSIKAVG